MGVVEVAVVLMEVANSEVGVGVSVEVVLARARAENSAVVPVAAPVEALPGEVAEPTPADRAAAPVGVQTAAEEQAAVPKAEEVVDSGEAAWVRRPAGAVATLEEEALVVTEAEGVAAVLVRRLAGTAAGMASAARGLAAQARATSASAAAALAAAEAGLALEDTGVDWGAPVVACLEDEEASEPTQVATVPVTAIRVGAETDPVVTGVAVALE